MSLFSQADIYLLCLTNSSKIKITFTDRALCLSIIDDASNRVFYLQNQCTMGFGLIKQVLNHRDLILRKLIAAQIQKDQLRQGIDYSDNPIE